MAKKEEKKKGKVSSHFNDPARLHRDHYHLDSNKWTSWSGMARMLVSHCRTGTCSHNKNKYKICSDYLLTIISKHVAGILLVTVPILFPLIRRLVLWGKHYYSCFPGKWSLWELNDSWKVIRLGGSRIKNRTQLYPTPNLVFTFQYYWFSIFNSGHSDAEAKCVSSCVSSLLIEIWSMIIWIHLSLVSF